MPKPNMSWAIARARLVSVACVIGTIRFPCLFIRAGGGCCGDWEEDKGLKKVLLQVEIMNPAFEL